MLVHWPFLLSKREVSGETQLIALRDSRQLRKAHLIEQQRHSQAAHLRDIPHETVAVCNEQQLSAE